MSAILSIKSIKNRHDAYRGKECIKNWEPLRAHTMETINLKKKNEVIDKQIAEIIRKCKNLLYLKKKL